MDYHLVINIFNINTFSVSINHVSINKQQCKIKLMLEDKIIFYVYKYNYIESGSVYPTQYPQLHSTFI